VKNSGSTITQEELPHIFDSFWRGANAESVKGSGLGLYICRKLMEKMDGSIYAEAVDGEMCVTVVAGKA
jgi:Osmosensitive K+ channel histidine kinase